MERGAEFCVYEFKLEATSQGFVILVEHHVSIP